MTLYWDAGFDFRALYCELCGVPFRYMTRLIAFSELCTTPLLKYVVTGYMAVPSIGPVVQIYTFFISEIVLKINSLINGHSWKNLSNKLNKVALEYNTEYKTNTHEPILI